LSRGSVGQHPPNIKNRHQPLPLDLPLRRFAREKTFVPLGQGGTSGVLGPPLPTPRSAPLLNRRDFSGDSSQVPGSYRSETRVTMCAWKISSKAIGPQTVRRRRRGSDFCSQVIQYPKGLRPEGLPKCCHFRCNLQCEERFSS